MKKVYKNFDRRKCSVCIVFGDIHLLKSRSYMASSKAVVYEMFVAAKEIISNHQILSGPQSRRSQAQKEERREQNKSRLGGKEK